ncbi:exopolysaccharide biosynthesis polyprenyl glycosylphosphotransferase [Gillisia limnaea]|uniref:Exopolysaccharide biosynthesis polyprenyl glycosylphosphotransferase n=1 Tax=Gillisia limnaea (strain DSM 15749 / LMG 21470 / R-8282) TaxID=865937 RepID=H2BT52_GILLR|nr:exopolysaccharide biosynthesis polyprenyl glycosylphosphotransferase [Gillisia limnaea]EHQ02610.1 exopolysaccharide biosynthesis polyprenyl glycosylphosphotransferase [Gillisia limnaea DSM 15749]
MKGSYFIMPFSVVAHLVTINIVLYLLTPNTYLNFTAILGYNASWIFISIGMNFYSVERKERFITKFHKFLRHYFIFCLSYVAFFAIFEIQFSIGYQLFVLSFLLFLLVFYRWFFFAVRRLYRVEGGNFVNVVVIGKDKNIRTIKEIFKDPDFGYRYKGYFNNELSNETGYLGSVEKSYEFIMNNNIDEIYCLVSQVSNEELHKLISFADNNLKRLKLVPDNKEVFTRAMQVELFGNVPILNLRNSPLEQNYAKYGKRGFDIIFSSLVILLILSWLVPLLYLLTRMESRDPLFFKQIRQGYNKKSFWCYKFRSMRTNEQSDTKMCIKNDSRITRLGKVLRKTSIDELPQFINVFLGEMSVVGPRPHMETHTREYARSVDKYLVRHFAKPGITGLAQIKGYRGEITCKADIVNRTRFDIFYLEKWSPIMDLKIIYYTICNAITGDDKAF